MKTGKPIPEQKLEGWAGNPDNPNEEPFDYFYIYIQGQGTFQTNSLLYIRKSCIESAESNGKNKIITQIVKDSIVSNNYILKEEIIKEYKKKIKGPSFYKCKPLGIHDPLIPFSDYKECECIIFVHVKGGKDTIIARAKEIESK
jgi:hypothetical protein